MGKESYQYTIEDQDAHIFRECAEKGQVYDKDAASEQLHELPELYQGLQIVRRGIDPIVKPLENSLLNGTRTEQVAAARRINVLFEAVEQTVIKKQD